MISSVVSSSPSDYLDSLNAAHFVQQGLFPKKRHFNRLFESSFVFYKPQHIISGDFYWIGEKHGLKYLAVGDCIGHGVSAALLSVLVLNLFEYTIMNKGLKKTNKILKEVDKKFIESFKGFEHDVFDTPWVDLSLICIDEKTKMIHYSLANRKLLHVASDVDHNIYRGSSYPIGGWQIEEDRCFTPYTIPYKKGDMLYLGSDGFQDQNGGPKGKRYGSKRLHNFLASNNEVSLKKQVVALEKEFGQWKQDHEQVDDICIVGVQL